MNTVSIFNNDVGTMKATAHPPALRSRTTATSSSYCIGKVLGSLAILSVLLLTTSLQSAEFAATGPTPGPPPPCGGC